MLFDFCLRTHCSSPKRALDKERKKERKEEEEKELGEASGRQRRINYSSRFLPFDSLLISFPLSFSRLVKKSPTRLSRKRVEKCLEVELSFYSMLGRVVRRL